jgi:hypothetical protein
MAVTHNGNAMPIRRAQDIKAGAGSLGVQPIQRRVEKIPKPAVLPRQLTLFCKFWGQCFYLCGIRHSCAKVVHLHRN